MTLVKKTIKSLLSLVILDQIYLTIAFPLVTLIFFDRESRLFSADTTYAVRSMWYGMCISLPNLINAFFTPLLSALSDEFGRKKILLIEVFSAFIFMLSVGLGIYLGILAFIFLGFIIKGAFSRTNPTALTIIGDIAPKEKKILYMGYLQFAISVGASIGPILGGYFAHRFLFTELNFSLPFFIGAGFALFNTVFVSFFIHETLKKRVTSIKNTFQFHRLKQMILHPDVLRISLVLLLIQISWSSYYQFMPPLLKTIYNFNSHQLGWFIGLIACWLAIAASVGIHFLHRFLTIQQMLLVSIYLMIGGFILITLTCCTPIFSHPILIWISAIPIATGDVIAYSCLTTLYSNSVAHEEQGKVMGISYIVTSSVWALTGLLGGLLMSISPLLPIVIAPLGVVISLWLIHAKFGKKLILNYSTG